MKKSYTCIVWFTMRQMHPAVSQTNWTILKPAFGLCACLWFGGACLWRSTHCGWYRRPATKHISQMRLRESKNIKGPRGSVAGGKAQMFSI